MRRGEDLLHRYRIAGEDLYHRAYGEQVPEFQGVPATMITSTERPLPVACNAMNTNLYSSHYKRLEVASLWM